MQKHQNVTVAGQDCSGTHVLLTGIKVSCFFRPGEGFWKAVETTLSEAGLDLVCSWRDCG